MEESGVVVVPAYVDVADENKTQWIARCTEPASPFTGLFALGADFRAARQALAETVWAAICGGSTTVKPVDVKGVRILALTRKTFRPDELAEPA